jgi:hypothetical protein
MLNIKLHPYSEVSCVKMTLYEESKEIGQRRRAASIDRDFDNNYCIFNGEEAISDEGVLIPEIKSPYTFPMRIVFYEEKSYMLKARFCYSVHKPYDIVYKCDDVYDIEITVQPPFQFKVSWTDVLEVGCFGTLNVKI